MRALPNRPGLLTKEQDVLRSVLVDIIVMISFAGILAGAHLLPLPLYQLDPMKILILFTLTFSNRGNTMIMAVLVPLVSFVLTGHPMFPKFLLISIELLVFAWILSRGIQISWNKWISFFSAILLSKFAYYGVKASAIGLGALQQELFTSDLKSQLLALVILCIFFAIFFQREIRAEDSSPDID